LILVSLEYPWDLALAVEDQLVQITRQLAPAAAAS
jgi:hypothetical protein